MAIKLTIEINETQLVLLRKYGDVFGLSPEQAATQLAVRGAADWDAKVTKYDTLLTEIRNLQGQFYGYINRTRGSSSPEGQG